MQGYSIERSQREEGTVNSRARYLIQHLKDSLGHFHLLFTMVTFQKLLFPFHDVIPIASMYPPEAPISLTYFKS